MTKDQYRIVYKQKRVGLSPMEIERFDRHILRGLQDLDYASMSFLHVYLPIAKWKEYDTMPYIQWLRANHPHISIVVSKSYPQTGLLQHFVWDHHARTIENVWGIPEPINEDELIEVYPEQLDAVIIPLLVCDRFGNRIGYGKGFYDRFLRECRDNVSKIGVSYFEAIEEVIAADNWDIALNVLVNPYGVIRF